LFKEERLFAPTWGHFDGHREPADLEVEAVFQMTLWVGLSSPDWHDSCEKIYDQADELRGKDRKRDHPILEKAGEPVMGSQKIMRLSLIILFCAPWLVFSAERGSCFQVELTVDERAGVSRTETPLTAGVPLPKGVLFSDQDAQIGGVPAQFTTLSRWQDGSVKWLLCDFQADVGAYGRSTYYLAGGLGNTSDTPLMATEDADSIVVVTGPLKFIVSKMNFNLFQRLWLDLNEDGQFASEEEMISPHSEDGALVTDDFGNRFYSSLDGDVSVVVEEVGPLRLVILAQGWHRDESGQRKLDFTVRIHALSGKSFLRVFYTFYNRQSTVLGGQWTDPPPESYIDVQDISLRSHINLQGAVSYAFGGSGGAVHSGGLGEGENAYIYAYGTVTPGDLHYLIGGSGSGSGGRARGWADVSDSRWGLTTAIGQFWQHHPKGIEVNAGGEIWVRILPQYYDSFPINPGDPFTAADLIYCGAAKTHEVLYYFHAGDHLLANSEAQARSFENPLFAVASPWAYTSSEALGKILPRDISIIKPEYQWIVQAWEDKIEEMFNTILDYRESSHWSGKNEYGMWNYGDSWQAEWSNMQYDTPYSLYTLFARTGDLRYFDLATDQAQHYRDVDIIYHMGEQEAGSFQEAAVGISRYLPNTNHGLGSFRIGYPPLKGPGLILHYYLTGDRQSLYGGKMQADCVRNSALRFDRDFIFYGPRTLGLGIQALLAYYQATGDETYLNNGEYHLGDMDGSKKASAYTLVRKVHEFQNIQPDCTDVWAVWGDHGCDCDDGLKFADINYAGCSWSAVLAWDAVRHYYEITADTVARDDVLRGMAWMCDPSRTYLWNGEYFYKFDPNIYPDNGDIGQEGSGGIVGLLGFAFHHTGNIDYINKAISALNASITNLGPTTDPKLFAERTRTVPQFIYYLSEEYTNQDTVPPNPPTDLHDTNITENSISLAWTPPGPASDGDGASSYSIYRDLTPVGTAPGPQYEDSGLPESTVFDYAVYSVDNGGNFSLAAAAGTFSTLADGSPPTLISVSPASPIELIVVFSEPVEETSAENVSNYQVNQGVDVLSASLHADQVTVSLTTTPHVEGLLYTITINGVRDRAAEPNLIAPNTSYDYELQPQLLVTELSPAGYQADYLQVNDEYYIDRTYTITSLPGDKTECLWIKTANDDKFNEEEEFLTFTINTDADIYVGYDDRATSLPLWITNSFADTGQVVEVTDAASPLHLWVRHFPAGAVSLGGNMAPGADGPESMYIVFLKAEENAPDTVGPQISNLMVSGITPAEASVSWTTDELSDSQVEYGLDSNYGLTSPVDATLTWNHQVVISLPPPAVKSAVTGSSLRNPESLASRMRNSAGHPDEILSTKDTSGEVCYHYRALSRDASGNLTASEDDSFTVALGDVIPPQILNLQIWSVMDTSALVGWETDEPARAAFNYGLESGNYLWSLEDTSLVTAHQFSLQELAPATTYHFQAWSADQAGNWSISSDTTLVTKHPLPKQPGKPMHYDD
jgi:chitodextrinase